MADHPLDPAKETVFLHELSPALERELLRRARAHGRDLPDEAAEIIEKHVAEDETI